MPLDLSDCQFQGPALPEPFVKFELERELMRLKLLPKATGAEGKALKEGWDVYRRKLRDLGAVGGSLRVRNHVIEPLIPRLGYDRFDEARQVQTREDLESGGVLLTTADGQSHLRVWTTSFDEDLYAPTKRGRAYRFSHLRIAQRVLLAVGERVGLLTDGVQLLLLISDPARLDSTVTFPLDPGWKRARDIPDSYRVLLALASPTGVKAIPELVDKARLQQVRVTTDLRKQAREAVEGFLQEVLDHPENHGALAEFPDRQALARQLWHEGLVTVYRLLFILKLEFSDNLAQSFSFASTSLWRNSFSPGIALAGYAPRVLNDGAETGRMLESGLRALFRMLEEGLQCTELNVKPLGGALFGKAAAPLLSRLRWGERAVAWLLDRLLWTLRKRGANTRERVHYGALDVEDLGRVYEALLELEPGITGEPMCRLRRQRLEVVVPLAQGERYRPAQPADNDTPDDDTEMEDEAETDDEEVDEPARGKKTKVKWVGAIPPGRFFLRVGLGRKASGSYYTPHSFVRFLVQETLGPQVAERSPETDPNPGSILKLKVLDPAMGSGHFLVEACRFLGEKLYEACRLCDERATEAERRAEQARTAEARERTGAEARRLRQRILDLPDPDDEMLTYLPSRSPEKEESGLSQQRAVALCRRLVATHCLYGVDKNPLAVELAKLALWLESHAEGMPLTFLDHRLVVGDSLTGPFWERLLFYPGDPNKPIAGLFEKDLYKNFSRMLGQALQHVRRLEATVGIDLGDIREKEAAKVELDRALLPFRVVAAAWAGGVMLGAERCDDEAYVDLIKSVGATGILPARIASNRLRAMIARGMGIGSVPEDREALFQCVRSEDCVPALQYDLRFPEVFYPAGTPQGRQGFHVVLGNPPWDKVKNELKNTVGAFYFPILEMDRKTEWEPLANAILSTNEEAKAFWERSCEANADLKSLISATLNRESEHRDTTNPTGDQDLFMLFVSRSLNLITVSGTIGLVVSGGLIKNPAARPTRAELFTTNQLVALRHFHNRRLLFADLPGIIEFSLVVAARGSPKPDARASIGLNLFEFAELDHNAPDTRYFRASFEELINKGGNQLILTRAQEDLAEADDTQSLASWIDCQHVKLGTDFHRTQDDSEYVPLKELYSEADDARDPDVSERLWSAGYAPLRTSRSIWQFTDVPDQRHRRWDPRINLVAKYSSGKSANRFELARYYRIAIRETCGSPKTNERSLVPRPG